MSATSPPSPRPGNRKLGFLDYQATDDSFFKLFGRLREARIIP
jgi:hypothetical protein